MSAQIVFSLIRKDIGGDWRFSERIFWKSCFINVLYFRMKFTKKKIKNLFIPYRIIRHARKIPFCRYSAYTVIRPHWNTTRRRLGDRLERSHLLLSAWYYVKRQHDRGEVPLSVFTRGRDFCDDTILETRT